MNISTPISEIGTSAYYPDFMVRPTIKSTMEVKEHGSLPFLDTKITRQMVT